MGQLGGQGGGFYGDKVAPQGSQQDVGPLPVNKNVPGQMMTYFPDITPGPHGFNAQPGNVGAWGSQTVNGPMIPMRPTPGFSSPQDVQNNTPDWMLKTPKGMR